MSNNTNLPLGLRNNNPLNIRVSSIQWRGKTASNNGFEKFKDLESGIRAGLINLRTYYKSYGLQNVSQIINRWAPSNENDTNGYVNYVAQRMGVSPTQKLSLDKDTFSTLFAAMSEMELGKKYGISSASVKEVITKYGLI